MARAGTAENPCQGVPKRGGTAWRDLPVDHPCAPWAAPCTGVQGQDGTPGHLGKPLGIKRASPRPREGLWGRVCTPCWAFVPMRAAPARGAGGCSWLSCLQAHRLKVIWVKVKFKSCSQLQHPWFLLPSHSLWNSSFWYFNFFWADFKEERWVETDGCQQTNACEAQLRISYKNPKLGTRRILLI